MNEEKNMPTYQEYRDETKVSDEQIQIELEELVRTSKDQEQFESRCREKFGYAISLTVDWERCVPKQRMVSLHIIRTKQPARVFTAKVNV
jgi:hypothetical protein